MRSAVVIVFCILSTTLKAQYFEIGLFGGVSNYQGDLAPVAFVPAETHMSYGYFTRFNINKYFTVKASIYHGDISGDDLNSKNEWKIQRNLSFKSSLNEVSVFSEINVLGFQPHYRKNLFSPYFFVGVGYFGFNPRAFYQGTWYDLQPLGTEGQGTTYYSDRKPYKLQQICIPMGAGLKASVTEHWNIAIEMGWRKTFTDYLDDVSSTYVDKDVITLENGPLAWELSNRQDESPLGAPGYIPGDNKFRGDPSHYDWYIFSGVTVSYNFGLLGWDTHKPMRYKEGSRYNGIRSSRKKMDCPGMNVSKKKK